MIDKYKPYKQGVMLIGGQEKFNALEQIWRNITTYIDKVEIFKKRATKAGYNYNQIMCFLEM